MFTTTLRTVGGSVMFAIPKPMLDGLGLHANQQVGLSISEGWMIVDPKVKPRYSLVELLAECDFDAPMGIDEREWLNTPTIGREII